MINSALVSITKFMVKDVSGREFDADDIVNMLNISKDKLLRQIKYAYVTEITKTKESITVTSGVTAVLATAIGEAVFLGSHGIKQVKVTSGAKARIIYGDNEELTDNYFYDGTKRDPVAILKNNKIYMKPTTTSSIDVDYLDIITDIANDSATCVINAMLHDLIIKGAVAELLKTDNKTYERGLAEEKIFIDEIARLNAEV